MKDFKLYRKPKEERLLLNAIKEDPKDTFKLIYKIIACVAGFLVFIGVWIYAIVSWGFLIGGCYRLVPSAYCRGYSGVLVAVGGVDRSYSGNFNFWIKTYFQRRLSRGVFWYCVVVIE